ncbi:MAG: dUTP diphosphatase [Clostridia bacterium]|nr:dUTP diphosphatase [Clostridia bacterium]
MDLLIKKLDERAIVPKAATGGSAGMDLCALLDEPLTIAPGQRALVPTGLAIALPNADYVALLFARSGLAVKHGITLSNCVGVVDSDYRGEVKVGLINQSDKAYEIAPGERIAQMVIMPVVVPNPVEADELPESDRGAGGFGSTGRGI